MDTQTLKLTRDTLIQDVEREFPCTLRVLKAAAVGDQNYKPDPNSKTAFELAWHTASSDIWFLDSIASGAFSGSDESGPPANIKKVGDVAAWYEKTFASSLEKVKGLSPDALLKPLNFYNIVTQPAVLYLAFLRNHSIHHRGQLSAYLRAMGSKVPAIYGGSFDTPFKP